MQAAATQCTQAATQCTQAATQCMQATPPCTPGATNAAVIKTHHNDTALVRQLRDAGRIIEPLRDYHKDEVRAPRHGPRANPDPDPSPSL